MKGSLPLSLSGEDAKKIAKGAAIAAVGAVLTYAVDVVFPYLASRPEANAALFALFTTAVNALRKFLTDTTSK